ncbi:WD40-repeat-containing subunit of the 18S rRNA processing complex [Plasmopara halstedii]|uniref:WD40-repeat-containing subunit of the 18S rRNA processing complex n=1 Tax=Plasmopara halstedii TaxID=4781 RepID=A0A0P1AMU0_PLAHL|nr:WD40-repeat-containing subunit of the 18S rRNA processing complex [Plasmopara halstedii]CEG42709.1 WD40-repeat-containing subunit of the 18S rRNA processing complex [Plasmopara halstedii]|eukprot:XP_024579078.1 WD40-repeat-containing subunit of the 18S rRNA processing complex [Plasmopara halstedii]
MKFAYQFKHLCGSVYSQGNVIFTPDGNSVLSPVGNRVTQFDLINNTSRTFAFEARKNIERVAVSHNSRLLLIVDEDGRCLLINLKRGVVLYRFHFKQRVTALNFSPDDQYIAAAIGNKVQLWRTPGIVREFAPFVLHRTYTGHYADVVSVSWSHDAKFFVTSAEDLSARVFSVDSYPNFKPLTLSGHRDVVVGAFFAQDDRSIFTVGRDGGAFEWKYKLPYAEKTEQTTDESEEEQNENDEESETVENTKNSHLSCGDDESKSENEIASKTRKRKLSQSTSVPEIARAYKWYTCQKHVLKMDYAKVLCCTFHSSTGILVVGFSNGTFGLYELPAFVNIHTLSVTQNELETVAVNASGEWLAFASRKLGQLLVWEWRSETYVLKQQGHYFDLNAASYSPDGRLLATGADDAKVKLWDTNTGFCYVTFTEHSAPVTAVQFATSGQAVLSASLDGTVRAFDLNRYKNFRVLTTPEPTQFLSLALDQSGQVVCAGSMDPFNVYIWSLQTGRLTDVLSGHSGPVTSLAFSPSSSAEPVLASASWDHTVRLWNPFASKKSFIEPLAHPTDVLAVAIRPDGKQLASTTLNGAINIWNIEDGEQIGTIEGKRDIAGGRKESDLITAANNQLTKHFTSVCYSADGSLLLAGGRSKFVCIYAVESQLLLKKFQISHNLSLDGILEKLNNKNVTESGISKSALDAHLNDSEISSHKESDDLVGAKRAIDPGNRRKNMEVLSKAVLFSPTGRAWAAATTEGLLIYGLDESLAFDPFELDEDITPENISQALTRCEYSRALIMALHLNEEPLIARCVESVPVANILLVAKSLHCEMYLQRLLQLLAKRLECSPHLEFYLQWSLAVLNTHGQSLRDDPSNSATCLPPLRSLQKSIARHLQDLAKICDDNQFTLSYLKNLSKMQQTLKNH